MIELTDKDIEVIDAILSDSNGFYTEWEKEYAMVRVVSRLNYLNPLIKEITDKGYNLIEISQELNNEYNQLIALRRKDVKINNNILINYTPLICSHNWLRSSENVMFCNWCGETK